MMLASGSTLGPYTIRAEFGHSVLVALLVLSPVSCGPTPAERAAPRKSAAEAEAAIEVRALANEGFLLTSGERLFRLENAE